MKRIAAALLVLPLLGLLNGCPAVIVGGGAMAVGALEDRRTSGTMIDDDSIEVAVRQAVRERFGENTHVNVTSFNRSVLLTGEVPDEARKAESARSPRASRMCARSPTTFRSPRPPRLPRAPTIR